MSNDSKKTIKVSNTDDLRLALAAGYEASQIEIDNTEALAKARAEGVAEGKASGAPDTAALRAEAAKSERVRISKIHSLARKGFETEMKAAIDNGDSPEAFALALLTAAQDRGITLEAINRDAPNPAPHASPSDSDPKAGVPWDKINSAPQRM
jgi:hypothetical protein